MTTVQNLYNELGRLIEQGAGDLPIYGLTGSSSVSYEISFAFVRDVDYLAGCEIYGPLEDVSTAFVELSLD